MRKVYLFPHAPGVGSADLGFRATRRDAQSLAAGLTTVWFCEGATPVRTHQASTTRVSAGSAVEAPRQVARKARARMGPPAV